MDVMHAHHHQHDERSVEALLDLYRISEQDAQNIVEMAAPMRPMLSEMIDRWYEWLKLHPEYEQYFPDETSVKRAKLLQHEHWNVFFSAKIDEAYMAQRHRVGETHARIGLPLTMYFAGINMFTEIVIEEVRKLDLDTEKLSRMLTSFEKLMMLDASVIVDTYSNLVSETISAQSRSLMEMSTPVTEIWDGILLLPLVGIIDSERARDVMHASLDKIAQTQARIFILDISGVGVVDTAVANHLIKVTKATKLMGCESTISGVSPAIAQTIVELGVDVGKVKTTGTMMDALRDAFRKMGREITDLQ